MNPAAEIQIKNMSCPSSVRLWTESAQSQTRVYDNFQGLLESKHTDKETSYFLRENLARAFMQSHIGSKLPRNQNDFTTEEIIEQNKDIADLIRSHPSILFEAAADASKVVNHTIEKASKNTSLLISSGKKLND